MTLLRFKTPGADISMHVIACLGLLFLTQLKAPGQIIDPVQWNFELVSPQAPSGSTILARLTADIDDGWHVYSTTTPAGIPLDLKIDDSEAIKEWRAFQPEPLFVYDPNFQAQVEWYTGQAVLLFELDLAENLTGQHTIETRFRYGACDDRQCLPPKRKSSTVVLTINSATSLAVQAVPAGYQAAKTSPASLVVPTQDPVSSAEEFSAQEGIFGFILLAFGFGLVAVLTPCVFPMIPIYIGSFMEGGERPWSAVMRQATVFCLGVIVLFTALGAALSTIIGPFGLSQLGSNVWVNLLIACVLGFFALSMLGAFELTVPSEWTTGVSKRSMGSNAISTLMLSLVFTLASFACTGPFIGSLLAGSLASGSHVMPVLGMLMFSTGLSFPFFALAMFPALLNKMPRSGGWLAMTKRTVGLVIFAVGLKYLSNVDQVFGWGILTRERFLAVWIVLFTLCALYLWGLVRLGEESSTQGVGLVRLGMGAAFLVLAVILVPGMFGGKLGELDAHVPEAGNTGFGANSSNSMEWIKDDYYGAIAKARAAEKTLFITFTGYACSNCKWMKSNMFVKSEIRPLLEQFVRVELYTDGLEDLSEEHQQIQIEQFKSSTIPFYVLMQPDGSIAATFLGLTRDIGKFREFLMSAT